MAAKKTTKTEVPASVDEAAKKVMQALNVKKVFVSKDGYIFSQECDARAYVGKDGEYSIVTDGTISALRETVIETLKEALGQPAVVDPAIDKHAHIDEEDGN